MKEQIVPIIDNISFVDVERAVGTFCSYAAILVESAP